MNQLYVTSVKSKVFPQILKKKVLSIKPENGNIETEKHIFVEALNSFNFQLSSLNISYSFMQQIYDITFMLTDTVIDYFENILEKEQILKFQKELSEITILENKIKSINTLYKREKTFRTHLSILKKLQFRRDEIKFIIKEIVM